MTAGTYRETLGHRGFKPFLWTQFLGAFNDNLFKMAVSLLAVHTATAATAGRDLSLVGMVFVLPFLLFSGYAGQLADVFSKKKVLVVTKSLEIVAASLGLMAFLIGYPQLTYGVLFLIALQATFFSPAKYGILPEVLGDRDLSRANGLLEMSTFVAIVLGTAGGGVMFEAWHDRLWLVGLIVVAVAVIGTVLSFRIPDVRAAAPERAIDWSPWGEIAAGFRRLGRDRVLSLTVVGLSYFWFLGALLQLVMILFGSEVMGLGDRSIGILTTFAAIGIGVGSMAAGRLSGDKVELGLAPIGSIGMGVFSILLSRSGHSFALAAVNLGFAGFFGGLFAVPLNALLQQRSGEQEKGRLMAANNLANTVAILLASGSLWLCKDVLNMPADRILLVFGALTLAASVYVLSVVPEFMVRFTLWLLTHSIYRIRIVGQEHVPFRGAALLVCNHVSHVDGLLVGSSVQRFIRFLVYRPFYDHWALHHLLKMMKAIPVAESRRDVVGSFEHARQALESGHIVCVFAEGSITRTGNLLPFKRGFERIVEGLDVPIIPVYLDRVWGSIFSFKGGKFFWKLPMRIPYPVTVAFGAPLPSTTTAAEARLALMTLGAEVAIARRPSDETLGRQFIRTAKHRWRAFCMTDSTGRELTFGRALVGSLLLSRWVRERAPETNIGLLLPASVGGAVANIAVSLAGKVPVNLNFTAGRDAMTAALSRCGIKTIITSRAFLSKAGLEPGIESLVGMVFLEDILRELGGFRRARTFAIALLLPAWALNRIYLGRAEGDRLATIVFSSGSTGVPKGVMLTHRNVLANVDAVSQLFQLTPRDVMMGVLPFFHSFGFTGTLWLPMISGFGVAFHPNPMDAKTVGELAGRYRATLLISTPTFCSSYVRKCQPEQFAHLRYALVGAEKLREPVARAFKEKFGIDLLEGYGCTEMSPIVAVNIPDVLAGGQRQRGAEPGSVGHPLPGVVAKVIDPATGEGPLFGKEGLLLVNGPNRMAGYLGEPDKLNEVLRDGWYVTGDIATMDETGFIRITDRLSRFSKIAGEMVPHMKVEEQLLALLDEAHSCVVTGVPDPIKGERLVAFYTDHATAPRQLWQRLCECGLPRLWLPKCDDLHVIDAIPTLGTGKVDLRAVKQLAMECSVVEV
jgi:acyl-[acyl-carrier-protein]-phospholipid O-acyltransferase/long-chain-fatty-acid--[acyl-carrier-protein] ligase